MYHMLEYIQDWLRDVIVAHNIMSNRLKIRLLTHVSRVTGKPQPSGYAFEIFHSIDSVSEEKWRSMNSRNDLFLTAAYLKALEDEPPDNMQFRYVILYEHEKPVAIAYFQIVALSPNLHRPVRLSVPPKNESLHDRIHSKMRETPLLHVLICGNILLSGEHGFAAISSIDSSRLFHALAEVAYDIKNSEKKKNSIRAILIKDFYVKNEFRVPVFDQFGYYSLDTGPNMVIPIREHWHSFDDYLADMKGKYRRRVKSARKKGSKLKRKSLSYHEIIENQDILYHLYAQVVNQAKFKLFLLHLRYFAQLKKQLEDNFTLDAYSVDERIVGFTTIIFNGDSMEGYTHGLSYADNKHYEIYQNFLLDDVKAGIERKVSQINTGRTSIAMKSSIGAIPAEIEFVIRTSGRISNHVLKYILHYVKPSNEHSRNPFTN